MSDAHASIVIRPPLPVVWMPPQTVIWMANGPFPATMSDSKITLAATSNKTSRMEDCMMQAGIDRDGGGNYQVQRETRVDEE
jgi:hypothetical protein